MWKFPPRYVARMQRGVNVAGSLPELLSERGLTQDKFADLIGARRTEVNAWCKGRRNVGGKWLPIVALALNVPITRLGQIEALPEQPSMTDVLDLLRKLRTDSELGRHAAAGALEAIARQLARIEERLPESAEPGQEAGQ